MRCMSVKDGSGTDQKRLSEFAQIRRIASERGHHRLESFDDVHARRIRSSRSSSSSARSPTIVLQPLLGCSPGFNEPDHNGGRSRARNDVAGFASIEDSDIESALAKNGIVTPIGGCALLQDLPQSLTAETPSSG